MYEHRALYVCINQNLEGKLNLRAKLHTNTDRHTKRRPDRRADSKMDSRRDPKQYALNHSIPGSGMK